MTDDEATIAMVNANIQRADILPSERGFALKMKMDAMRCQGFFRQDIVKLGVIERKTATIVGEGSGLTGRSVQRYIRLTELIPEVLELVDTNRLSLVNGVEISYFDKTVQKWLHEYIKDNGNLKSEQIAALKEQRNLENLTQYTVKEILNDAFPKKNTVKKVSFSERKLLKYFPADYPASKCERIITELLEKWNWEQEIQDATQTF